MAAALPFAAVALSAVSAFGQYQAGRAEAKGLSRQATLKTIEFRGKELDARQQGIEVLKQINRSNATLNARAGAGGIDPFSGSAQSLAMYNISEGAREYYISEDNQIIAREGGQIAAQNLLKQAKSAQKAGLYQAVGTLGSAALSYSQIGGKPSNNKASIST